jgi:hypothetical protein
MRAWYWETDPPQVDSDDRLHEAVVTLGLVPQTCLLGGELLQAANNANRDPCETCPCPRRDFCRGRPRTSQQHDGPVEVDALDGSTVESRRLLRARMIRHIRKEAGVDES